MAWRSGGGLRDGLKLNAVAEFFEAG
ncbi:hypothetical protein HNR60_004697, partial [Rhodopseudomonas rhenobacensis]|nr:hypothetical protein [Rhodopseudomonas rhenobacensis]